MPIGSARGEMKGVLSRDGKTRDRTGKRCHTEATTEGARVRVDQPAFVFRSSIIITRAEGLIGDRKLDEDSPTIDCPGAGARSSDSGFRGSLRFAIEFELGANPTLTSRIAPLPARNAPSSRTSQLQCTRNVIQLIDGRLRARSIFAGVRDGGGGDHFPLVRSDARRRVFTSSLPHAESAGICGSSSL